MTVEQALAEAAKQLKENPREYIDKLMLFTDKVLERKLDIVREQKQMAFNQQKKESFELLNVKEDLIIKVRIMKSENENWEAPKRKVTKKKNKKVEEISDNQTEIEESESHYNDTETKDRGRSEQLLLDF